jgi:hypothetical protein
MSNLVELSVMASGEDEKWGRPPRPFDAVSRQLDFLFETAQVHNERAVTSVVESCRVVMLFSVGAILALASFAQSQEGQLVWLLLFPAIGFSIAAALVYDAGYLKLGEYHASARDVLAKEHGVLLNWALRVSGARESGATYDEAIGAAGEPPGEVELDDTQLLKAQQRRDAAQKVSIASLALALLVGLWIVSV